MRQDWVEFENTTNALSNDFTPPTAINFPVLLRPEYITAVLDTKNCVRINYDSGSGYENFFTTEPYEQVKQKIMDAEEPIDLNDVVVERFTEDEYKILISSVLSSIGNDVGTPNYKPLIEVRDKLNKILEEME